MFSFNPLHSNVLETNSGRLNAADLRQIRCRVEKWYQVSLKVAHNRLSHFGKNWGEEGMFSFNPSHSNVLKTNFDRLNAADLR